MKWPELLSTIRLGKENRNTDNQDARTSFQRDFDRIVFSSAFRRLQNKTQVKPLPSSDYVRNRLTHSIEAASVGRSLGTIAGYSIIKQNPELKGTYNKEDFGSVISAACLAHDIGNPPFGHAGEDAISEYYKSELAKEFLKSLNKEQVADLQNFEGNASGFRILSNTLPAQSSEEGGINLTYTTLATFTKYPKQSLPICKKTNNNKSDQKYGFFYSEKEIFKRIANRLGLIDETQEYYRWKRHPLAFLVEAADDICYNIIDYEDGFRIGNIKFQEIEADLINILAEEWNYCKKKYSLINEESNKIHYLRSKVINKLIHQCCDIFAQNETQILDGTFNRAILDEVEGKIVLKEIGEKSKKYIYSEREVLEIEAASFEVVKGLLDAFNNAIFTNSKYSKKILQLLPTQYLDVGKKRFDDDYINLINVTMFISSMTDTYAINLFRKIKGISLPNY